MNSNGNIPIGVSSLDISSVLGNKGYEQYFGEVF